MKKRIFKVLTVVAIVMAMSLNVMAAGSITGSIDENKTTAKDESGQSVTVTVDKNVTHSDTKVQTAIVAMKNANSDTTVESVLAGFDLSQIKRHDGATQSAVDVSQYKFLSPVYDLNLSVTPTPENPVKVTFVLTNMADNITVDVLHYCDSHGWELLEGKKLSSTELQVEFHSASPIAIIYRENGTSSGGSGSGSSGSASSGSASSGTSGASASVTSPKTGDVSVLPMMVLSVSLAAAGVFALKKSRKNEYV